MHKMTSQQLSRLVLLLIACVLVVKAQVHRKTSYFDPAQSEDGIRIENAVCPDKIETPGTFDGTYAEAAIQQGKELLCPEYLNKRNVCRNSCSKLTKNLLPMQTTYTVISNTTVNNTSIVNSTSFDIPCAAQTNAEMKPACNEAIRQLMCASACDYGFWNLAYNNEYVVIIVVC